MAHSHEFEQLDNGSAYCIRCPAVLGEFNELSAETIVRKREAEIIRGLRTGSELPPSNVESRDKLLHGSKDQEIENLKRLLANVSQRLDKLK